MITNTRLSRCGLIPCLQFIRQYMLNEISHFIILESTLHKLLRRLCLGSTGSFSFPSNNVHSIQRALELLYY